MRNGDRDISGDGSSLGFKRDLKVYGPGVSFLVSFLLSLPSFFVCVCVCVCFVFFLSFFLFSRVKDEGGVSHQEAGRCPQDSAWNFTRVSSCHRWSRRWGQAMATCTSTHPDTKRTSTMFLLPRPLTGCVPEMWSLGERAAFLQGYRGKGSSQNMYMSCDALFRLSIQGPF